jgi:hypothetical protein
LRVAPFVSHTVRQSPSHRRFTLGHRAGLVARYVLSAAAGLEYIGFSRTRRRLLSKPKAENHVEET